MSNIRSGAQNWFSVVFNPAPMGVFGKCEERIHFGLYFIFTDKDLPSGHSCYTGVIR